MGTRVADVHQARRSPWLIFILVFAAELAFGMWMNSRGIYPNDSASRASLALTSLYGSDPHLSAIGFSWMPLPTMLELSAAAFFPIWTAVVSSGFAFSVFAALAAGATAAVLMMACTRLGLPSWIGWAYALLISANPMLFLYGANGESEGIAAPFLIGAVCFLTLYWYSGQRLYIGVSGVLLALGFATVYEAVQYGAALCLALVGGLFWSSESRRSMPQGPWRAVEGLGLTLVLPSVFVGAVWITANAVVQGDPLYFTHGPYSSFAQNTALGAVAPTDSPYAVAGDLVDTLRFAAERTWPFLVPIVFLLFVRLLDRRLLRVNSLSLIVLSLSVPLGLIVPLLYRGLSAGYLRYFMYPLFVAAGWGLFEIAISRRRRRATCVILAGWIVTAGAVLWAMSVPNIGPETEHVVVRSVISGDAAEELDFENSILRAKPIARELEQGPLREGQSVVADQLRGFAIATNLDGKYLDQLILTPDRRFERIVTDPRQFAVKYFLVPSPAAFPADAIDRARPELWQGDEPGFELITDFPLSPTPEQWRLYAFTGAAAPAVPGPSR